MKAYVVTMVLFMLGACTTIENGEDVGVLFGLLVGLAAWAAYLLTK